MGTYIVLSKLNAAGLKTLTSNPDRLAEVAREIESMEGKVIEQWSTLGKFDMCSIVSAPDNAAMQRIAVETAARGRVQYTILPAIDLPLFVRLLGQTTETTGPYPWQIRFPARIVRRALRGRYMTKGVLASADPLTILGAENLDGLKSPAIFIGNHSSHLDSVVLFHALPERFKSRLTFGGAADRWFLKGLKGYKRQGWWASLTMNSFPINRGAGSKTLDYPKWLIDKKWSVMIFPEGTRSTTGKMGKFKHGVSILATEKGVPVVPIFMEGLYALRPKGAREAGRGPVTVRIGKPIHLAPGTTVPDATYEMYKAMEALRLEGIKAKHGDRLPEPPVDEPANVPTGASPAGQ